MKLCNLSRFEAKKQITIFRVIFVVVLILIELGLGFYSCRRWFTEEGREIRSNRLYLIDLFQKDRESYYDIRKDVYSRSDEYERQFGFQPNGSMPVFENNLIDYPDYGDRNLISDVDDLITAPDSYENTIKSLLHDSAIQLKTIDDKTGYFYSYYARLLNTYSKLVDIKWEPSAVYGWNSFFSSEYPTIIVFILCCGLFSGVFTCERTYNTDRIVYLTKYGRKITSVSKQIYIILSSAAVTIVFTLAPLLPIGLSEGLLGASLPVQALDNMRLCPLKIYIWQYLIIYIFVRVLFFSAVSLIVAAISFMSGSELYSFVFIFLCAAVSFVVYHFQTGMRYYKLSYFTPSAVAYVNTLFARYRAINVFGYCTDYLALIMIFLCLLIIITSLFLVIRSDNILVDSSVSLESIIKQVSYSIFSAETYKQYICFGGLMVIISVILLRCGLSFYNFSNSQGLSETTYREYIKRIEGPLTEEKLKFVSDEIEYIESTINQYNDMYRAGQNGEITRDEYSSYQNRYSYAQFCRIPCEKLFERTLYLKRIAETHSGIEFIYDEGIDRYLGRDTDIPVLLCSILFGSGIYALEYSSGFNRILRLTKRGRRRTFFIKSIQAAICGMIIYLGSLFIDIIFYYRYFDSVNLSSNIMSMPRFSGLDTEMSILKYIVIYQTIRFCGVLLSFLIVSCISLVLENRIKTVIVASVMFFMPYLFSRFGFTVFDAFNICRILCPEMVTKSEGPIFVISIVTAVLIYYSYMKWNGIYKHDSKA